MPLPTTITIIHRLPHRVRLRLTPQVDMEQLQRDMCFCPGLQSFSSESHSQSVLILFDPEQTNLEQVLLQLTVSLVPQIGEQTLRLLEYSRRADLKTVFLSLSFIASSRLFSELSGRQVLLQRLFKLSQWIMLPAALNAFGGGTLEVSELRLLPHDDGYELEVCRVFNMKERLLKLTWYRPLGLEN